ncbi:MAG: type III pantothenate kinase [Clostridia bacterium]|nr:type III pantothenate kinase [Clostridia bacterium]
MLFAVDIGNTDIKCAVFNGIDLYHKFRIGTGVRRTCHEYALTFSSMLSMSGCDITAIDSAVIGSVAPSVTGEVSEAILLLFGVEPLIVGPGVKTGFSIKLDDPSQLGADLAANAAAVTDGGFAPAIIVDMGTACTVSLINERKEFCGCAIMPGVQMSLDALNGAELLPTVCADKRVETLGKNTVNAMLGGVIRGSAMAITGFIDSFSKKCNKHDVPVVVTGGFAPLMLPYLKDDCAHRPNLTLEGLAAICRRNTK